MRSQESGFTNENEGWNYGINANALVGDSASASTQLLQRALTPPASGYRFPGFAPHMQDFDPCVWGFFCRCICACL